MFFDVLHQKNLKEINMNKMFLPSIEVIVPIVRLNTAGSNILITN